MSDHDAAATATVPSSCTVAGPLSAPPYAVQFQLHNTGTAPVFVHKGCVGYDYGLTSCASGYRDQIGHVVGCGCDCASPTCTGGVNCGGCPEAEGTSIAPGDSVSVSFDGISTTPEDKDSFTCIRSRLLPAAHYRVAVRVYATSDDAKNDVGGRSVTRDFELPAVTGVVEVSLAASPDNVCDATPSATVPTCTGAEARDVPCALRDSLTIGRDGGELSAWVDAESIAPPAMHTRTRMFNVTSMAPITCGAAIPRCARDPRVVTTGDIVSALSQPGVAAAFGADRPVFGQDARAFDGTILVLTRPDGTTLGLGGPCTGCAKPLTATLSTLETVIGTLSAQLLADPACAALR